MFRLVTLFIVFALEAVISHAATAQQSSTVQRIGFLGPTSAPPLEVFRKALVELGYEEGRNIIIDSRWPEGDRLDRLPEAAAALVSPAVLHAEVDQRKAAGLGDVDKVILLRWKTDPVA